MRHPVAFAAVLVLSASSARATISAFFQHVPITATTDLVTPPPGIAGYQSWDLMIMLSPGDDFTSFRFFFDPAGPIFQHTLGNGPPNFGPPASPLFSTFFALEFDSYLRGPYNGVIVIDSHNGDHLADHQPAPIFNTDRISVAAGDLTVNPGPATFQLARITFQGPFPELGVGLAGRVYSAQQQEGVAIVPEPAAFSTIAAGGLLAIRPRTRSRRRAS